MDTPIYCLFSTFETNIVFARAQYFFSNYYSFFFFFGVAAVFNELNMYYNMDF